MTFFYDLNKKLDSIREKPEVTHGQLNERDMSRAAKGYEKYGKEGMQALAKAGRDGKALDPVRAKYDKYDNKEVDEGLGDVVKKVGGAVLNKLGHGSDKDMRKDLQRKMGMTPTGDKPDGALKYAAKTFVKHAKDPLGLKNEAGLPMTTVNGKKVPKFAADGRGANDLARKKSFNDKIAGAKQEVEEMLGDVAAEAIKSALSPKQKKIDMNKNGKLDANDFAMLRKGGKQETDEGFPTVDSARDEMRKRKVGDVTHGAKHDTQEIPGGRRVTRRTDPNTGYSVGADDDSSADGEKRGRGRPKGTKGAIGAKGPSGRSKLMTREDHMDPDEYDNEGDMAKEQLHTMKLAAKELSSILGDDENLPEWVQSKITKALDYIDTARDYMISTKADRSMEPVAEKAVSKNQAVAARIARGVQKGEAKAEPGTASAEMAKMPTKELKKFAKTDTKKLPKKKEKTEEQGGTGTPTASSGFSYGKGIYDSLNRELEGMISEGMNINMSMNSDAHGGPSRSLTVTATDDDAVKLGQLLKMAGLGSAHTDDDTTSYHMDEAYGDNAVSENEPDYPTEQETAEDNLEYSGGLNGPKSTGQSTVPVLASQEERQHTYESDLQRMRDIAGIREAKKVEEDDMEEGNLFTGNLAKARADGKKEADLDGDGKMEKVDEGILASTADLWKTYKGQYGV